MKLVPGAAAKSFNTVDAFGRPVRLEDYAGQHLLLVFYRYSTCAMCNLHLHRLVQWSKNYPEDLKVVAVFESPAENILNNHPGQQNIPFPLIPDPTGQLYDLYGLESSESKVMASLAQPVVQQRVGEAAQLGFQLMKEEGGNFNRLTADFLIGPDQTIRLAHYADFVSDHLPFETVESYLVKVS
jgi:peroxiredoxin